MNNENPAFGALEIRPLTGNGENPVLTGDTKTSPIAYYASLGDIHRSSFGAIEIPYHRRNE